jgi:ABC-type antimicrobial peptide transport system permease subunit
VIGCVFGVLGTLIFGRLLESRLYGVQANDMLTMAGALAVVVSITVAASWVPARRAAATDPMEALRAE